MYLNSKEEKIIGKFFIICDEYEGKEVTLKWEDGSTIKGKYDSFIEDENDYELDDEKYEEYWSFVFEAVEVSGKPPVYITEDNFFCVNYKNFPDEIICNGEKLN